MTGIIVGAVVNIVAFIIGYACGWKVLREKTIKDLQKLTSDFLKVDDVANRLVNVLGRIDPLAVAEADAEQRIADMHTETEEGTDSLGIPNLLKAAKAANAADDEDDRLMALGDEVLKQYVPKEHHESTEADEDCDDE